MAQKSLWKWVSTCFLLIFVLLSLIPFNVQAQQSIGGLDTDCGFQTMNPDGESIINIMFPRTNSGNNLVWDTVFSGFHKWSSGEWAGIDVLQPVRLPFKKGGVVRYAPNSYGGNGGYLMIVQGKGKCSDWYAGFLHMPNQKFSVGNEIGGKEIIAEPGCSGFENYCIPGSTDGSNPPPHVHIHTLYCGSGTINFNDNSSVDWISIGDLGLNCQSIHPARLENESLHAVDASKEDTSFTTNTEVASDEVGSGRMEIQEVPTEVVLVENAEETPVKNNIKFNWIHSILVIVGVVVVVGTIFFFIRGNTIIDSGYTGNSHPSALPMIVVAVLVFSVMGYLLWSITPNIQAKIPVIVSSPTPIPTIELTAEPKTVPDEAQNDDNKTSEEKSEKCRVSKAYPDDILQWCNLIMKHAKKNQIDPDLIAALIWQESGGNPVAYSKSGAVGLMQIMPRDGIAASFMCKNGPCFANRPSIEEMQDPEANIEYGTRMLANLVSKQGSIRDALKAYGPMDVGYYYADKVLGIYNAYKK